MEGNKNGGVFLGENGYIVNRSPNIYLPSNHVLKSENNEIKGKNYGNTKKKFICDEY